MQPHLRNPCAVLFLFDDTKEIKIKRNFFRNRWKDGKSDDLHLAGC
jgi:hypothetical protein